MAKKPDCKRKRFAKRPIFFFRQDSRRTIDVALWPRESDPTKIILRSGADDLAINGR